MNKRTSDTASDFDKPPLPSGWCWTTLGDLTESMKNGIYRPASSYANDGIPCLRMYNIDQGKLVWKDIKRMVLSEDEVSEYELLPGDLLVNRVNSRELVGKTVAIPSNLERCVFESKNIRIRLRKETVIPEYASYYLLAEGSRYFMQNAQQVVGMASINQSQVASFPFPLAPIQEQHRILEEIEKHFTRLDAGVAALRRIQIELKRYRSSVLKAACEGRLVPNEVQLAKVENRSVETGEALLARILTERRENWQGRGKYKEPKPTNMKEFSVLPDGWTWATFDQLAERVTVGFVGTMKHEYVQEGIPFLRGQNVRENRFDPDGLLFIRPEFHQKLAKSTIRPGDLTIVRSGSVGVTCVIPDSLPEANCSDLVLVQRPLGFIPHYGAYFMNSLAKRHVEEGKVGVALTHFNTKSVATLPVPLPPLAEQTRIVAEVERRLSVVENLQVIVADNLQRAARMRKAVLRLAFAGQLVSQDQSDMPASLNVRAKDPTPLPISAQRTTSRKRTKAMSNKPAATLIGLLECLDSLGGSSAPERLFMALKFGNDVEAFFDLLRQGKNENVLDVPFGNDSIIRRAGHAS